MKEIKTVPQLLGHFLASSPDGDLAQVFVVEALDRYATRLMNLEHDQLEIMSATFDMLGLNRVATHWSELSAEFFAEEGGEE